MKFILLLDNNMKKSDVIVNQSNATFEYDKITRK